MSTDITQRLYENILVQRGWTRWRISSLKNLLTEAKGELERCESDLASLEPLLDGQSAKPSSTKPRTSGSRQRRRQGTGD